MNRSVMERQMFQNGGAAGLKPIPEGNMGLPNLPEDVRNKMGYMAEGGDPMMMSEGIMSTAPAMQGPSPEMMAQQGAEMMDPNTVASMIEGAEAAGFSDPEAAGSFEEMMNSVSGENKSAEERRSDLASIVGPEDASQTPESVLALVTPVVELALVDQGIGPMAQEQMNTPVEGDMGEGIMSMAANGNMGVGNEPPVNFNLGGEVRRRGDEDPVPVFMNGGAVQYFAPENTNRVATITPMTDYQQKVGETAEALLPTFQAFMPTKSAEERKQALQSDILFDIANTALAFAAPMQGEKEGMSAAERLAMATQQTKLLPTIAARTAASRKEAAAADTAAKTAALQGALGLETARLKQVGAERVTSIKEAQQNARTVKELDFKKKEGVSNRNHKTALANQETQLKQYLQTLKGKQDLESIAARSTYEQALQRLKGEQKILQMGIEQENKLEQINTEITGRKDVATLNNIASMERKIKDIESNENITDKNNATKKLISDEKNNTDKLINQNNIAQQNKRLEFDKVRESNLVAQRKAENQQAIANLDLKKVTEARKTLEGLRDYELKKAEGERDQQKIALIEKELNEVKIAETQIKKFSAEKRAENDVNVLAFKNKELNKLVEYRKESNQIKSEMNQITRSNNVINQQLKEKEIALKKHKAQLEIFGTGVRGRIMNIMADPNRYEAYAEGSDDNVLEQAITDYASEQTDIRTGAKTQRELPPYMKEVLKKRLAKGLSIPVPISKLGLSKAELDQYAPISDEKGEASLNKIIDPEVDLTEATGIMSTLKMGVRWAAGQASEFIPGGAQGDIFSTTSTGRKMLNALANATEGFLREAVSNDRLDKDTVALIRQDIMRPSGGTTDANALAQLKQTRQTMKATIDRLNKMIDNPSEYSEKQVTDARGTVNLIEDLISNYSLAISGYEKSFNRGSGAEVKKLFKGVFNRRKE